MKPIEIKIFLLKNQLTLSEIARQIMDDFPDATEESVRTMLTQTVNQKTWYPKIERVVNQRFGNIGLRLVRPVHLQPLPHRRAA